jgi:cyclic beta-1,2-glucan synthetase
MAQLTFLIAGFTLLPGSPLRWTLLGLGAIAAPYILSVLLAVVRVPRDKSWLAYYAAVGQDAALSMQQIALAITFLPHQAWVSADAILRTLWRLFVKRKNLLEWRTASQTERTVSRGAGPVWRTMWPAVAIPMVLLALGFRAALHSAEGEDRFWAMMGAALPLMLLWFGSPWIAQEISAPVVRRERRLPPASRAAAMRYALLHWRFFERFVGEETHWLAPDNFQEDPAPVVAMRTSPTNIGLQLLATVSAHDHGFITTEEMARRLEQAFRSLEGMRRLHGHFYNWYDLHDLKVLEPAYVSTVDSGNLAGHLIALRHACLGIPDEPVFDARVWRALGTAIQLAQERLRDLAGSRLAVSLGAIGSLAQAEEQLRSVTAALTAADAAAPLVTLGAVTRGLEQAKAALESFPTIGAEDSAAAWIGWSLRLAAQHTERLAGIELPVALGREARPVSRSESWRRAAEGSAAAAELISRVTALAERAYDYALEMDFRFLYDESRGLFSIGYQAGSPSLDGSYYDLLASEARLASFLAVAKNDVPVEHWFRLGRTLTRAAGETALVSWSGSMFEYLMPGLVMQSFPYTVLDQTYRGAVQRHIAYGKERNVPWGVSESAFNLRDRFHTYQYRAFGVPDLALKRGLGRDLVIAPYASALAAMVLAQRAIGNLMVLERKGALGPFGFRDAIDYTRPAPGEDYGLVRTYMAHHVGMSLVALTNALGAEIWPRRFHADAMVRAAELLLHERAPRRLEFQEPQTSRADEALPDPELERPVVREVDTPDTPSPHVVLLGHLPYTIMVSHCGAGYSRYEELAVTRWRADATRDNTGQFCYLRDPTTQRIWSAGHQPVCAPADWYHALLATDRVTLRRSDGDIETRTEIVPVPADAAEVRRVTVTNNGATVREIELTSYGEIVLATPDADRSHPAFGNLFVETEYHEWCTAITATRRPRSADERSLWCVHVVDTGKERVGPVTCETDRSRFLGRGRTTRDPIAVESEGRLSGTTGAVLDPIFALRTRIRLEPRQSASVAFTTLVATTRERAFELAGRYHDAYSAQRALDLAWTSAQVDLRELNISPIDAGVFQELAGHLFYANRWLRAPQDELSRNHGSQPLLWSIGVSGDWPILLATIDTPEGLPTLRQLLVAHHYWRRRGMMVDLVVLNTKPPSYQQELDEKITAAIYASPDAGMVDRPGGVFARRRELLAPEALRMLRATARVHVPCDGRSLGRLIESIAAKDQVVTEDLESLPPPPRSSGRYQAPSLLTLLRIRAIESARTLLSSAGQSLTTKGEAGPLAPSTEMRPAEESGNGFGRLTADGDYEIRVRAGQLPPAPWANVIANQHGGFLVTERGAGFTWALSSYFFRLTPWHNDPVSDPAGEALYLRDERTGELWSPTPAPLTTSGEYVVTHAPGKTSFEHQHGPISTRLIQGMADDAAVKLSLLQLTNRDTETRRIALTAFAEWCLGSQREHTQHQVLTSFDDGREAILARNFFDPDFAGQVAFCALSEPIVHHTADRREFLGRNGTVSSPDALHVPLSGNTGAGLDPCAVLRTVVELQPGESREVVVVLGAAMGDAAARQALDQYRDVRATKASLDRAHNRWIERLSAVTVHTPEPLFDAMLNRWALYQALSCRIWARSGLYQSSGAYGFRDQLQDVTALVYTEPALAREHILRAAGRQFAEGDVQHWWHPQSGRGVRTRFSDDLVWLPYVVDHYLRVTGDESLLDEVVAFLSMRQLGADEHEIYDRPEVSDRLGSVYEHCIRALRHACTSGDHGLPLIGGGDWNDGMNRVGIGGKGESVWLAWFLIATLRGFAEHAERRGDGDTASKLRSAAAGYAQSVERHGWDGEWYRRAYYDDGVPLGSAASEECQIDSIAQSWSVISGAGDTERRSRAMQSLEQRLVWDETRILPLLTPPFDKTTRDPGYIKGYLPGVRENGAQYTHAALWAVLATALQGNGKRAFELFQMINPLTRTRTADEVDIYQVEPYVVAADVYTAVGHIGRGGWTWYTGSASWMYRIGLESILGFTKRGAELRLNPRVPPEWPEFSLVYRYGGATYQIRVERPCEAGRGDQEVVLDGQVQKTPAIPLVDDGKQHDVVVRPIGLL